MSGRWIIFIIAILATKPSVSQEVMDSIHLPSVEIKSFISSPLTPGSKFLISEEMLQQNRSFSLGELLSLSTPIFIKSYGLGGLATASFRGTTASHTKVYWEGMNINSPMIGQSDFSLIPVFFIDEVAVYPGSSSLNQGGGALGGAIAINSRPEWNKKSNIELMVEGGSFSTLRTYFSLSQILGQTSLKLRLYRENAKNDFPFLNTASGTFETERQKNAALNKVGGLLDINRILNRKNDISLHIWLQRVDRNLPPIMSYSGIGREEFQIDEEFRAVGQWNHFGERFSSTVKLGGSLVRNRYHLSNKTPLGSVVNYDTDGESLNAFSRWDSRWELSETMFIKGRLEANYDRVNIFDKKTDLGYSADRGTTLFQLSGHKQLGPMTAYVLLQQTLVSDSEIPIIYAGGLNIIVDEESRFETGANFSRNYNIPSLNDLYWVPGGNRNLRPEKGHIGDVYFKFKSKNSKFWKTVLGTSIFAGLMDDWILWRPSDFRFWTAENIQSVFTRGIEFTSNVNFHYAEEKEIWLKAIYSFTRTTDESESRKSQLIYIPIHKGNVLLGWKYRNFSARYILEITGERFTNSENRATRHRLPTFSIHSLNIQYTMKVRKVDMDFNLRVNNLFNESYQAILWRAMPGRHFSLSANFRI